MGVIAAESFLSRQLAALIRPDRWSRGAKTLRLETMKTITFECIAPLLAILRGHPVLREVRPAVFHLHGRDFIHFHEEPDGVFADVRLATGQIRMPVATQADRAELLERIEGALASLASHAGRQRTQASRARQRRRPE